MMNNKLKDHYRKNSGIYKGIGIGFAAGVGLTAGVFAMRPTANLGTVAKVTQGIAVNSPVTQNVINVVGNGHAGKVVRAVFPNGTSRTFESFSAAEKSLGINRKVISDCTKGLKESAKGIRFEYLGDAMSSQ